MADPEKYTFVIRKTEEYPEEPFVARVIEFPYSAGYGKTSEEAYAVALKAIRTFEEEKLSLPNPLPHINEFSGRISLRIPKSLHRKLASYAEVEGVSINQYLGNLLSWASENYYSSRQNVALQFSIFGISPLAQIGENPDIPRQRWSMLHDSLSKTSDQSGRVASPLALSSDSQAQMLDKRENRDMVNA
jgi:predicted RNase H-like HicB family nuclease